MRFPRIRPRPQPRLSLTQQVALLSLIPVVALGFILTRVIEGQIVAHSVADASQSARLIAQIGIQPRLSSQTLDHGLSTAGVRDLDKQLRARSSAADLARIKIWNAHDKVVYSDAHDLIGRTLPASDELKNALAGSPKDAAVVDPTRGSETAGEVGLGRLVEVYVPIRFNAVGPPAGVFEIYLSYRPIAAALARDTRMIALVVAIGLALLWAVLFRIVARASRRLRRQARENYELARFDQLTGLPNRTLFQERVAKALERGRPPGHALAVMLIDLDGFKAINNTLGDRTGDGVLRVVGGRLSQELGEDGLVARLGADEYAILSLHSDGLPGAVARAAAIQASFEAPIVVEQLAVNVDASVGIAVAEAGCEDAHTLLEHADAALARAQSHRGRIEVYSPQTDSFDAARLLLLGEVRRGLDRGEFELHYQPKQELRSGRICGVEALLRWRHPQRGLLMPAEFVELVEQTALVGPLALYVVEHALRQLVRWRARGIRLGMSVNMSARNLLDPELPKQIFALLNAHQVPCGQLTVEVTESATMVNPERALEVLCALNDAGVCVSIDDFGTGNASIAYLTSLPAREIKIDRAFVTPICEDGRAEAITRSTIDLARHLDMHVVAEGIETEAAMERLRELGCDTGQGYLISRPMEAQALTDLLGASKGPDEAADARTSRRARAAFAAG